VILDLVNEQPRHGYDIIRALEEQFEGLYSPSPGTVYPTLSLLEDQGFIVSDQQEGKKVYRTTEAGQAEVAKHADTLRAIRDRIGARPVFESLGDVRPIVGELWELGQTVMRAAKRGDLSEGNRVERLQAEIRRSREAIDAILSGPAGDASPAPPKADDTPADE
jgi:DNA-binding PadR family transcriptional regulator